MAKQWIYTLTKDELTERMAGLGLNTDGTLDELRTATSQFVTDNPALFPVKTTGGAATTSARRTTTEERLGTTPRIRGANMSTSITETSEVGDGARTLDQIRKWGCHFDGKDPLSFLERIEELQQCYELTDTQMLRGLPELLRGEVLLWYRNHRAAWHTWPDFLGAFRDQYLPYRYHAQLRREVLGRGQKKGEPFRQYATTLLTMMRRAGGFTRHDQIDLLYENMTPELKLYIRRDDTRTIGELSTRATEIEDIDRQRRGITEKPTIARVTVAAATYNPAECCWRCKQRGHTRRNCRRPAKRFCSQCGKDGVMTRDCHPWPGNAEGAEEPRDTPRPPEPSR